MIVVILFNESIDILIDISELTRYNGVIKIFGLMVKIVDEKGEHFD